MKLIMHVNRINEMGKWTWRLPTEMKYSDYPTILPLDIQLEDFRPAYLDVRNLTDLKGVNFG